MKPTKRLPAWVWYALCCLLPMAVLTLAYALEGFYPFGDKSILSYDMAQQYVEYFCALKNGDLFFSWSKALGSSYIGVFSYYLSSPLSLLTLLVPNEAMPLGLMALCVLKLGLAGLSYAIFARHYFDRLDVCALLCALGYALCSYAVAYSMCVMWLDGLIWLPIILLGLERLMDRACRWLFPASLAVCFFSTWYISYMIGGFCLLWFLFRALSKGVRGKELLRSLLDLLLCALWALCLTAWLWLPSLLAMTGGKLASAGGDLRGSFAFPLTQLLPQFFYGSFSFFYDQALPYVFCGTALFLAAVGYFFLKTVPLRQRLAGAGVLLALILSMWASALDRVWHFFQPTHSFPYRYAFLVSFLLLFFAQHTLHALKDAHLMARGMALALSALLCWELCGNARLIFQTVDRCEPYQSYSAYLSDYRANAALVAAAKTDASGEVFYRVGATHDRGLNSPLAFGYNGLTHYSSLYDQALNATLKDLGFAQTWYWSAYYGSTPFTDALFDIRYVITDRAIPGYRLVEERGGLSLWANPSVLPLAFVPRSLPAQVSGPSHLEAQNLLFTALTGQPQLLFTPIEPQVAAYDGYSVLTYQGSGKAIYLDLSDSAVTDLQLDGQSLFRFPAHTSKTRCLHCLGAPAAGESLTVLVTHNGPWDPAGLSATLDQDLLAWGVDALDAGVELQRVTRSQLSLTARTDAPQTLATTIPAQDGWRAYVDGKGVDTRTWLGGTFLALDLPAGEHRLTLRYTAPGLPLGLALGVAALAWAGGAWCLHRRKRA